MLRKLIKHELRATARTMGLMLGVLLLTAVGGNIAIYELESFAHPLLNVLGAVLLAAFALAMLSVWFVAFVLMIRRFYKNLLQSEGYLMMTLPVSVHKQILAKTVVSVLWFVCTGAAMTLALGVLFFRLELVDSAWELIRTFMAELADMWGVISVQSRTLIACMAAYLPLIVLLVLANLCLNCYAAMAIGHSFSGRKGFKSFAAYAVLTVMWQMLGSCAAWTLEATGLGAQIAGALSRLPDIAETHMVLIGAIAMLAAGCAVSHAITAHFLARRLNLE